MNHLHTCGKIVISCKSSKFLTLSGMIMDQEAVRALALMGRVMVEEIPVQASMVIRVDTTIRVIRAVRVATISSSNNRVIRATRSS